MRFAEEGHQVVLAHGVEGDVADEHQLPVILAKRFVQHFGGVLVQPGAGFAVGARYASRSFLQPLAVGVLPDGEKQFTNGRLCPLLVEGTGVERLLWVVH